MISGSSARNAWSGYASRRDAAIRLAPRVSCLSVACVLDVCDSAITPTPVYLPFTFAVDPRLWPDSLRRRNPLKAARALQIFRIWDVLAPRCRNHESLVIFGHSQQSRHVFEVARGHS